MKVDLNGKVALITGAGNGIGQAIALAMAANGASIVVNDLPGSEGGTVEQVRALGQRAVFVAADVSRREEVEQLVSKAESEVGPIDILVNNAGINTSGPLRRSIHEYDEAEWRRVLSVDLDGVFYCCRAVTPGMVSRGSGVVINIASVLGLVPMRLQIAYSSAKAAVVNFTRAAALELAPYGIRANVIAPGSILTPATRALFYNPERKALMESLLSHIPLHRPGEPSDIANAALYLASPDSAYVTAAVLTVDGGWTAGFAREW